MESGMRNCAERLMAVVGPNPDSEFLIRLAARAAESADGWFAVYVDTGRVFSEQERRQLDASMDLARALGAHVITTAGVDFVDAVLRVAQQENVTRLIVDKSLRGPWWQRWSGRSPLDRLVEQSGDIDTHLVTPRHPFKGTRAFLPMAARGWREWALALGLGVGMTALGAIIEMTVGYHSVPAVYLVILIISALFLSRWPLMLLAVGSTMAWWFFILPQRFSLRIHRPEDGLMLALFFVAALVSGHLAALLRSREQGGIEGELTARTLYDLLRELNENQDLENGGIERAAEKIERIFQARVAVLLPKGEGQALFPCPAGHLALPDNELEVAAWTSRHGKWAGRGTDTYPHAQATHVPLLFGKTVRGVLAVQLAAGETWTVLQHELMESIARLLAQVMEKEETSRQARSAGIAMESQKMQRALVDNFSHELHTPISVLSSVIQHLRQQNPPERERDILAEAKMAVDRLKLVVSEMTDLAQIECGTLRPALEWCETADFLQEWLDGKTNGISSDRIRMTLPGKSVYVRVDTRLLNTALDNLLHNALRHAPSGTAVQIDALTQGNRLLIRVCDKGPGIPAEHIDRIFERFFRGAKEAPGGLGLGLPVARQFIELLGGTIQAEPPPGGGACFTLSLPCVMELPLAKDANP
jgi:two-component system sensor histidine kinase KdpD